MATVKIEVVDFHKLVENISQPSQDGTVMVTEIRNGGVNIFAHGEYVIKKIKQHFKLVYDAENGKACFTTPMPISKALSKLNYLFAWIA